MGTSGFSLADADFCVLHSPFVKMVRKGFARLVYQDHLRAHIRRSASQVTLSQNPFSASLLCQSCFCILEITDPQRKQGVQAAKTDTGAGYRSRRWRWAAAEAQAAEQQRVCRDAPAATPAAAGTERQ